MASAQTTDQSLNGWRAGETVHVYTNDEIAELMSRTAYVVARRLQAGTLASVVFGGRRMWLSTAALDVAAPIESTEL